MLVVRHNYRYFPYELDLARRELSHLLSPAAAHEVDGGFELDGVRQPGDARGLVYFSAYEVKGDRAPTMQALLEATNGNGRRQSTRYSVHGMHEYKGKFNPQIARALFNILLPLARTGHSVLDPFCGSGTTLVEAVHAGLPAVGVDSNPFAVFLANAKLASMSVSPSLLYSEMHRVCRTSERPGKGRERLGSDDRSTYLERWFEPGTLNYIERLKAGILTAEKSVQPAMLALVSNLLRDYSLQDPGDLRIRRRRTPLPSVPMGEAIAQATAVLCAKIEAAQAVAGTPGKAVVAILGDARDIRARPSPRGKFGMAVTSPPYAMALPYVDTQRLSLVWLGLAQPNEIATLDSGLIGSREWKQGGSPLVRELNDNAGNLPDEQWRLCRRMQRALVDSDGFRRQAAPGLLYRYFTAMRDSFVSVRRAMQRNAPYAMVVGGNYTVLGGKRFDIDTPSHLLALAVSVGWRLREMHRLQTYQRYGYHVRNSIRSEAVVVLEA